MTRSAKTPAPPETVGVLLQLPLGVHRKAKAAAALAGLGWNEAAAEAFQEWAARRMAGEGGRR